MKNLCKSYASLEWKRRNNPKKELGMTDLEKSTQSIIDKVQSAIDAIDKKIEGLEKKIEGYKPLLSYPTQSSSVGQIYGALAKSQGEYLPLTENEDGVFGEYANLKAILAATIPALSKNAIFFYQNLTLLDSSNTPTLLTTLLGHSSGEWLASYARIIPGSTDRITSNVIEINKRIHALMLLGIAPSKNDPIAFDDNGNEQENERIKREVQKPMKERELNRAKVIDKQRYETLLQHLKGHDDLAKQILITYSIENLCDLPDEVFQDAIARITSIKRFKNNIRSEL